MQWAAHVGWGIPLHYRRIGVAHALLLCIIVVGAWLRLRDLTTDSMWYDEAASWLQSKGTLAELISATAQDNYPPLHNLLLYAFMGVSGADSELVLRLPSALLGIANIAAIYWLSALIGGRVAGVLAAAMLASSSMHIYFSQEARMYTLLALASTLYTACAFHFVKGPTVPRAALLAICGLALVYSHPFGTLNWLSIAIGISAMMLLMPDFPRLALARWAIANAAIGIGFLPWAVILLGRAKAIAGSFWIKYPTALYIYGQFLRLSGGPWAGAALLAGAGAAIALRSNLRTILVLLVWLVAPIAVALIVSWTTTTPIFLSRYVIGGLPALATLAAVGMAHLLSSPQWWTRASAAVLLAGVMVGNLTSGPRPRDDWRTIAGYLESRLTESDCVLVYPAQQVVALRYYLRRPVCTLLPSSIAEVDVDKLPTRRLFAVLVFNTPSLRELNHFVDTLGNDVNAMDVGNVSILEYSRKE